MMSRNPARFLGGLVAFFLALVPIAGSTTMPLRSVQIDGSHYESQQFGYVVEWDQRWAGLDRHVVSLRGDRDEMMLSNNDGRLWVIGYPDDIDKSEALTITLDRFTSTASEIVITGMDNTADLPYAELTADRDHLQIEIQPVEDATVAIVLMARDDNFNAALMAAQGGVFLNDGAILMQEAVPAVPSREVPTEEPEATEEPTEQPEATEEPTEEPAGSGESWESEQFDVSLDLPSGWTIAGEGTAEGTADTLTITNGTSVITLYLTNQYDGDLEGCISFAKDFADDDPEHADMRLQATETGDPYEGSDDISAYALFSYTSDDDVQMAWYVHCQYIVEDESVLILMQDVPQDQYQSERKERAAVLNAIDLP